MSTTRTADPTATQAPASPPVAGVLLQEVLPADGDPLTAASVAQAFKVIADYDAFRGAPFGNAANQAQKILAAQCARLLARAGFDHRGYIGGNWNSWREDWTDGGAATKTSNSGGPHWFGPWNWSANAIAGNATVAVTAPSIAADICAWLTLTGSNSGPAAAVVERSRGLQWSTGNQVDMVMEFLLRFDVINGSSSFAAGIFDGTLVGLAPTAAFETLNPKGIGLYLPVGGTNLLFYANESGTPDAPVDTGVAAAINTTYRVRLEMQDATTSDNSAARYVCKINGAVKADAAPGPLPIMALTPAFMAHDSSGSGGVMKIGAPRGTYALQSGNVFE